MKLVHLVSLILVTIGALNWGIIGAFGADANVVHMIFGGAPYVERIIYILVGLGAIFLLLTYNRYCEVIHRLYKD